MDALNIMLTGNTFGRTDESPVGKKLFVVTWIDSDDSEDTKIEIWIANDDDDLYDLIVKESVSAYDSEDTKIELWIANDDDDLYDLIVAESVSAYERDGIVDEGEVDSAVLDIYRKSIEDSWGSEILYAEIGTII
jgi:hypothetical protein